MLDLSLMDGKKMTDKELQELGRKLQDFYEFGGEVGKWRVLRFTALKGIAQGFGIFIGGTLVVALLIWILGLFDSIPLIDRLNQAVQRSIGG